MTALNTWRHRDSYRVYPVHVGFEHYWGFGFSYRGRPSNPALGMDKTFVWKMGTYVITFEGKKVFGANSIYGAAGAKTGPVFLMVAYQYEDQPSWNCTLSVNPIGLYNLIAGKEPKRPDHGK